MNLLEQITIDGVTTSELKESTKLPISTLYDNLNNLISEGVIVKDGNKYRRLRETPSMTTLLDYLQEYHGQRLMDYKYRRKNKEEQHDICLQWLINVKIKGKLEEYNFDELENSINHAYNIFTK